MLRRTLRPIPALVALAVLLALPTGADILVLNDGSKVETKGEWEVKGRQVIFTLPNGTLSAVRLTEVDLDASADATEAWKNPPAAVEAAPKETTKREPVLVLTNADIGAGSADVGAEAGDGAGDAQTAAGDQQASGGVVVVEWTYDPAGDDPVYQVTGRLENQTGSAVEQIQVYVDIIAVDGGTPRPDVHLLREALVSEARLEPNESTEFRYGVSVRDLEYSRAPGEQFESPQVNFDVQFRPVTTRRNSADASDEDFSDDEESDDVQP